MSEHYIKNINQKFLERGRAKAVQDEFNSYQDGFYIEPWTAAADVVAPRFPSELRQTPRWVTSIFYWHTRKLQVEKRQKRTQLREMRLPRRELKTKFNINYHRNNSIDSLIALSFITQPSKYIAISPVSKYRAGAMTIRSVEWHHESDKNALRWLQTL